MDSGFYTMIEFAGADRLSFLQGQLTQDLDLLQSAVSLPAAWCSAKGRVIVCGQLVDMEGAIGMVIPASMLDSVRKRLTMYRLRADVSIEVNDAEWRAMAYSRHDNATLLDQAELQPADSAGASCRSGDLVAINQIGSERYVEVYGPQQAFDAAGLSAASHFDSTQWQQERIASGRPEIVAENSEQYTPHMLNLDLTGAVSFSKGCYTGQEIVARTQHLGKVKRRLNHYRLNDCSATVGDSLSDGERDVGKVVNVCGDRILALTPIAQHDATLQLGSGTATPLPLPYQLS